MVLLFTSLRVSTVAAAKEVTADNPLATVLAERFPQTKVGDCDFSQKTSSHYKDTEIHFYQNGAISITGVANDGSQWNASINVSPMARCEIWSAALNQGTVSAFIVMAWNLDSSGGWQTAMDLILFSDQGKPLPWRASSFFHVDEKGVQEIVKRPGSSNASILVPVREGNRTYGFAYAYDLYDVIGDGLQAANDIRYGVKWPFIPQKSQDLAALAVGQLENLAKTVPAAQYPEIQVEIDMLHERLSTIRPSVNGLMSSLTRHPGDGKLQLQLENGPVVGFPDILVKDTAANVRSINFQPDEEDVRGAVSDSHKIEFMGRGCLDRTCNPLIMKVVSR